METLRQLWPLLVPLAILWLALMIVALVDLIRRKRTRGPKWVWALVIVLVSTFGPILYLLLGREEEHVSDSD